MTLQDLLDLKKITYIEFEIYMLFACSEMGRSWFNASLMDSFMDQPSPNHCHGEVFAYMDGRRSIFRNIKSVMDNVENLLKETLNDSRIED